MPYSSFVLLLFLLEVAVAQSGPWGQCGGNDWKGPTTCISGFTCTFSNPWYSHCVQGATTVASTTTINVPNSTTKTTTISSTVPPTQTSTNSSGTGLAVLAAAAGKKYFGTATNNPELADARYVALLSNIKDFNQLTAEYLMNWDATEPSHGTFAFGYGDAIAKLAMKNGQLLRGDTPASGTVSYPTGLIMATSTTPLSSPLCQLTAALSSPTTRLYAYYVNSFMMTLIVDSSSFTDSWDVVNEPFNDNGTWRNSIFYTTIGSGYVATALKAARAADPTAKLYINDYNLEHNSDKTTSMVNLIKSLLAAGIPIDGVGFQGHLIVGQVPSGFKAAMQQFTDLGLEVAITELDIRMTLPATAALLAQQKTDYQNVIAICKSLPKCVGVTIWDYTDKYSSVPSIFLGQGAALPWDENFVKKPAYDGIVAGFQ
ncbi:hypothetical protein D9619_004096 [Psilocybe cf. subviscida]|uniref:Beta-xylanase n=1 Tax=Psilocybe cf. subviscida TaxID=2480587 RepID=A0A8H5BQ35_9AGAR|nr:hypothetical protein D9619_004096 [Psilocybe cf. subviscida]